MSLNIDHRPYGLEPCVNDPTRLILTQVFGYLSFMCWILVGVPQAYQNYKRKSGDSLSLTFLVFWLIGDIFNITGVILEDLLFAMFLVGVWYGVMDSILLAQYCYYSRYSKEEILPTTVVLTPLPTESGTSSPKTPESPPGSGNVSVTAISKQLNKTLKTTLVDNGLKPFHVKLLFVAVFIFCGTWVTRQSDVVQPERDLLEETNEESIHDYRATIGLVCGYISAIFYLSSPIPQLIKNYKTGSVEGLSMSLFALSMLGNSSYAAQIFCCSTEGSFISANLPFLLGALGSLFFDFGVLTQFYFFNSNKKIDEK